MEILSKKQILKGPVKYNWFFTGSQVFRDITRVELYQSIVIHYKDWPMSSQPNSTYVNYMLKQTGRIARFKMKRIDYGKNFAFTRIK